MKRMFAWLPACALVACSGGAQKKIEERMAEAEKAKAAKKTEDDKKEAAAKPEPVHLDAFWDDASYIKIPPDGDCPEGMWALFPGFTPGQDKAEKKENEKKRSEYAKKLKDATFLVHLKPPEGVKLGEYDAPKGEFPLDVAGSIDCSDSFGHLTVAWSNAKAITPGLSAAKQGAEVAQNIWVADPMTYKYAVRSQADAKEFNNKHRFDLDARVVFKLGKTQVDKKIFHTSKQTSGSITIGGGDEDWGAGRMVKADLSGIRIATEHEKTALVEKKGK